MTNMIYLLLLALAAIFLIKGYFLLEPHSSIRNKLKRSFQVGCILIPVTYLGLLVVNFSSTRGGCALGFLGLPLDEISRMGDMIFQGVTRPLTRERLGLALALALGLGVTIIFMNKSRARFAILWASLSISLLAVTYWGEKEFTFYWICCAAGTVGCLLTRIFPLETEDTERRSSIIVIMSFILVGGFLLRFFRLDIFPPSLLDYEGTTGLSGIEVLEGRREYFSLLWSFIARPIMNTYSSPFFAFPLGWTFRIFGVSVITLRSLSSLIGTLTIPAIYLLVRQRSSNREALLTAFFLSISIWHITISRVGLSLILTPLYAITIGGLLLRAFKTNKIVYFLLAGCGLGIYWLFYMVAKIMLIVVALMLFHQILLGQGFLRRNWKGLIIFFLAILAMAMIFGEGISHWLLGTGKQGVNYIWYRSGPNSAYSPEIQLNAAYQYLILNIQKSFRYLFIFSHHEFLLPSKLPFINPLIFPFVISGLAISLYNWKRELHFFFLALFFCAFIPQVIFVTFSDKAAPRHLMLLIPVCCFMAAQPFSLLLGSLSRGSSRWFKTVCTAITIVLATALAATAFYITFLSPHWKYPVCRMRRECGEFIRDNLDQNYFFIVRGKFPLYLQNRIIDFITYPKVRALHYHLAVDYPRQGKAGKGIAKNYAYIQAKELPAVFSRLGTEIPRAGFVFEQKELVPVFEERFGDGAVIERAGECAPWVYYTFLYPPVP